MNIYAGASAIDLKTILYRFVRLLVGTAHASHFAAISGYENATGIDRTGALGDELRSRGFSVIEGFGSYKGEKERSLFVVPSAVDGRFTETELRALRHLAAAYYQESFFLNNDWGAVFQYPNGKIEQVNGGRYMLGDAVKDLDYYSEFAGVAFSVV